MYKVTLFSPNGDSVTDFNNTQTIESVWDKVNDMGSRWVFFPLVFVTTEKTVVDAPEPFEFLKGKRIKTVKKWVIENTENLIDFCNS